MHSRVTLSFLSAITEATGQMNEISDAHVGGLGFWDLDGLCCSRGLDDYFYRLLCTQADFGKDHSILRDIL